MGNITVGRYDNPAEVGCQGWLEPGDRSWVAFVASDGKPAIPPEEKSVTLGDLAERWGEPTARIADAVDAVRVLNGERTYIG